MSNLIYNCMLLSKFHTAYEYFFLFVLAFSTVLKNISFMDTTATTIVQILAILS